MAGKQAQLPAKAGQEAPKAAAPASLALVDKIGQELQSISEANFYSVPTRGGGTRTEPDARALQHYANKNGGIATQIVDAGIDDKHAWARIRGWLIGSPDGPKEDQVTILFSAEMDRLIWDKVDKGCQRHKNVGCPVLRQDNKVVFKNNAPILSDPLCMMDLVRQMNRIVAFGDRTCITKAEARLHKKLLNFEWREEEEIEHERAEAATIGESHRLPASAIADASKAPQQPPAAPQTAQRPAETKAPAPKAEPPKAPAKAAAPAPGPMAAPKAEIPPAGQPAEETKPMTRTKRLEAISNATHCSSTNLTVFLCRHLGASDSSVAELKKLGAQKIDATIIALEETIKQCSGAPVGAMIRDEAQQDQNVKNFFLERFKAALG